MKKNFLNGTITALVTPFKKDGSIDFKALDGLIDFQIKNKVDGIVICGSTGESSALTDKEKMALYIHCVEYAAGKIAVIAGTGSNETDHALSLTVYAKDKGADAALIVTPYYNKPSQEGLYEHFRLIAKNVDIPIIIYNIPGRTGVNMTAETQLKLANECHNVVATKEASGDLDQMMQIIKHAPEHFSLLSGDDSLALPVISIGGKGVISVLSNYAPKEFGDMIRLALKGKFAEAKELHYKFLDLMDLNFVEPNPAPVKSALAQMGMIKDIIRMPLLPVSADNKKKIKDALKAAGLN